MEPSVLVPLAFGFLIGFAIEWALDLVFWRRRRAAVWETDLGEELIRLRSQKTSLEAEVDAARKRLEALDSDKSSATLPDEPDPRLMAMEVEIELRMETISALEARVQGLEADIEQREASYHMVSSPPDGPSSRDDVRVFAAKAAALERDVESLRAISAAKDQAVAQSQEALAKLEAQLAFRPSTEDLQRLNEQIASRDQALETLRNSLAKMQESQESADFVRTSLETRLAEKEQALAAAEAACNELEHQIRSQSDLPDQEEWKRLTLQLTEKDQAHQAVQAEFARLQETQRDLEVERTNLEARLAAAEVALEHLEQQIRSQGDLPDQEEWKRLTLQLTEKDLAHQAVQAELARVQETQRDLEVANTNLEARVAAAEAARKELELQTSRLDDLPGPEELERLKAQVSEKELALQAVRAELATAEETLARSDDQFAALRRQIAEQEAALAEADTLRARLEQDLRDLTSVRGLTQAVPTNQQELSDLRAEIAARDTALGRLDDLVARLQSSIQDIEGSRSKTSEDRPANRAINEPRPVLSVTSFSGDGGGRRDPLIQIRGIGHLFERKLWDAGVTTFSQLAALNPDQVFDIIQPAEWQRIEPERWIAEATALSLGTGT